MHPNVVIDIGNTFIKWGRCADAAVLERVSLPPNDFATWNAQAKLWNLPTPAIWALASVQPERCTRLIDWLNQRGDRFLVLDTFTKLPLNVLVAEPDCVGIDRLLDAVAANAAKRRGAAAVVIDAGSAVTVDWVDAEGRFGGGTIFPGLRLMAQTLHDHTALLPLIEIKMRAPLPGTSTPAAMAAGVFRAVVGGIRTITEELAPFHSIDMVDVFLTGGDAALLETPLRESLVAPLSLHLHHVPLLTLEGIRIAAEALP
jgi:type III pantothenate kinase